MHQNHLTFEVKAFSDENARRLKGAGNFFITFGVSLNKRHSRLLFAFTIASGQRLISRRRKRIRQSCPSCPSCGWNSVSACEFQIPELCDEHSSRALIPDSLEKPYLMQILDI